MIKKKYLVFSTALTVAVLTGIIAMVYANEGMPVAASAPAFACIDNAKALNSNGATAQFFEENNGTMPIMPACAWQPRFGKLGFGHRRGFGGFIEVSQEFVESVTNIAKADPDVSNLLASGYNVTHVKPIIKTVIGEDGTVVTKATNATIMLVKDTTGRATVWVDVQAAKVTRIETLTRTVIVKP